MNVARFFVCVGVGVVWLLLAAPPMFESLHGAYTGVHLVTTPALITRPRVRVDRSSPAYRAGLRTGDVLGCMSPRDALLILGGGDAAYRPGTTLSACAIRDGSTISVHFQARPGPPVYNGYPSYLFSALRIVVALVFVLIGIMLVLAKPSLMTWLLYAYCVANTPGYAAEVNASALAPWQYLIVQGLPTVGDFMAVWLLLLFALVVPEATPPRGWRRTAFYAFGVLAVGDLIWVVFEQFASGVVINTSAIDYPVDEMFTGITVLVVIARLATMRREERARFTWAAFAIVFGVIANDLRNVLSGSPTTTMWANVAAYSTVVMPLTLMYAILRRHVIDVRFVLGRGVVFGIVTTLIVAIIGLVDWATSAYLSQVRVALAIDAAVTIALGIALHRSYGWVERAVDALLFRRTHSAESYLRRVARTLPRAEDLSEIDAVLAADPCEKLELTMSAVFRKHGAGYALKAAMNWNAPEAFEIPGRHDLVRFLATERTRLAIADLRSCVRTEFREAGALPVVAIPILRGGELFAFALYGLHQDGTQLDPDELEVLEYLCSAAAQAYMAVQLRRYEQAPAVRPAMESL